MLELLGVALVIVGTYLGFRSARQVTGANAKTKIAWSGRIANQPRSASTLRSASGALVIIGALCLFSVLNAGVIALVFVASLAPLLVFVAHNRRIEKAAA